MILAKVFSNIYKESGIILIDSMGKSISVVIQKKKNQLQLNY